MPKKLVQCKLPASGTIIKVTPEVKVEIDDIEADRDHWESQFFALLNIAEGLASDKKRCHAQAVRELETMLEELEGDDEEQLAA